MLPLGLPIPLLFLVKSVLFLQDLFCLSILALHLFFVVERHVVVIYRLKRGPLLPDGGGLRGQLRGLKEVPYLLSELVVNLSILIEVLLFVLHGLGFDLNLCCLFLPLDPSHLLLHKIKLLYLVQFLYLFSSPRGDELDALTLTPEWDLSGGRDEASLLFLFVNRVIVNNGYCILVKFTCLWLLNIVTKPV